MNTKQPMLFFFNYWACRRTGIVLCETFQCNIIFTNYFGIKLTVCKTCPQSGPLRPSGQSHVKSLP